MDAILRATTHENAANMSAPELLWTGRSKEMALTCNVETVFIGFLNPGVWPVDPNRVRVEAESTQASLHVSARNAAQARVACRSRTAEAILSARVLPGHFGGMDVQVRLHMAQ